MTSARQIQKKPLEGGRVGKEDGGSSQDQILRESRALVLDTMRGGRALRPLSPALLKQSSEGMRGGNVELDDIKRKNVDQCFRIFEYRVKREN